jgi:uncharacterized membrane protein
MATTYSSESPGAEVHHAHPIHAMLSAYPLAFFTGALVTDVIYANTAQMQWANFSIWLITGGLLMGVLAAVAGIVDAVVFRRRRVKRQGSWIHSLGTALMMLLAFVNAFVHSRDAWTSVVPTGIVLSAIVAVLALATSWQGYALHARQEAR